MNNKFLIIIVTLFFLLLLPNVNGLVVGGLNYVQSNASYYADILPPNITIHSPSGGLSSLGFIINTTVIDNRSTNCYYRVTDSNLIEKIAKTSFDCDNTTASVSSSGNFIIFVNATDGVHETEENSSFTVTLAGPPIGGGGSGSTTPEKPSCNINVLPIQVVLNQNYQLAEVKITNNNDLTYDPDISITDVSGEESYKTLIKITNLPGQILPGDSSSFGLKLESKETTVGRNNLVLSDKNCKDITIPIFINQKGDAPLTLTNLFDPTKSVIDNFINILASPMIPFEPVEFLTVWMFLVIFILIIFYLIISKIIAKHKQRSRIQVVLIFLLGLITAMFITFVMFSIINLL